MPDDPIYQTSAAEGTPAPAATQGSGGAADQTTGPDTEAVNKAVEAQLAPVKEALESLGGRLGNMDNFFTQLQEQANQTTAQAAHEAEANKPDLSQRLYTDAEGALSEFVQNQTGPVVAAAGETIGDFILQREQARVDEAWGEGAWEKMIWPELKPTIDGLKRTDPGQLIKQEGIRNAVDTLVGRAASSGNLTEHREEFSKNQEAAETEKVTKLMSAVNGNLRGGIRTADNGKPTLSTEHKDHLADIIRSTGETPNEDALAKTISLSKSTSGTGTTLSAWQSIQEESK
jgi:hypothetical protein